MNTKRWWMTSLVLALVLLAAVPVLAQPSQGGGPRWQDPQPGSPAAPGPGPGYRTCPNYPGYQNCPYGNTPQGPRGPRGSGRYNPSPPPANPPAVNQ